MADLSGVRFLTVGEVAEMMRVSNMTVYRLVHSGELPAVRFGRSFRIPESAVEAAIVSSAVLIGPVGPCPLGRIQFSEVIYGFRHQEAPQAHG
jgi:excisionase family DNA binding protein